MLKMLRQLKGDSPDTAKVRAEAYDELREVDSFFSGGKAKTASLSDNSLSLGGVEAALWAKLVDVIALSGRVTTVEGYFSGASEVETLFSRFARLLKPHSITGTTNLLTQIQAEFVTTGPGLKFYAADSTCGGLPSATDIRAIAFGISSTIRVIAVTATTSKEMWTISYSSSWDSAWTKLTDASVYMNPSGASLQSGTMTSETTYTANYSGHLYIKGNVQTANGVSFYIDGVAVDIAWSNIYFNKAIPIKAGQTFKVSCNTGIASCNYVIRASK